MPLDTRIALGVQPLQVPDPLAQYGQVQNILAAQTQRQTGQLHAQQLQFQMDQAKEAQDAIGQIMGAVQEHGGPSDPMVAAMQMLQHRNPTVQATGRHLMDSAQILRAYQSDKAFAERGRQPPSAAPSVAAGPSAPIDETMKADWIRNAPAGIPYEQYAASQTTGATAPVAPPTQVVQARPLQAPGVALPPVSNQLAPAPVAPVNQLAAPVSKVDQIDAEINDLMNNPKYMYSPQAKARIEFLNKRRDQLTKAHVVGTNLVTEEGKAIYTGKEKDSPFEQLLSKSNLSEDQKIALRIAKAKTEASHAPPVTVNVSTEKKYGEKLAGNIADRDDAKLGAAEKAPELAASANRIIDLVKQGNLFTGPIADVKLNIARALNVVGASNEEKIANTEALIAATGQSTLDAIKGAGLGTGAGFTDKDLNFLRGIAGGTIELTPQTLTRLATLQHQTATRSVQAWNTRFKDIPKSSVEGMGLRTAPDVPPLSPSAMFAVNPKTGERIQSVDGGNTWKPVGVK